MTEQRIYDRLERAKPLWARRIMAGCGLAIVIFLAVILQHQVASAKAFTHQMCLQRQTNTVLTNKTWSKLEAIERDNGNVTEEVRNARIAVYEQAKLTVPVCTGT